MSVTTNEDIAGHPLYAVLCEAIRQATSGKGERHGGAVTPFLEQPWRHYAQLHGRGFLTGQAAKKLEEAASKREGEAFVSEVLGAIVYAGMAVLFEREIARPAASEAVASVIQGLEVTHMDSNSDHPANILRVLGFGVPVLRHPVVPPVVIKEQSHENL